MKRGPKSKLTPQLQKHICESLEKCNTIKTSMQNAGLSDRVFFDWVKNNPSFSAAVYRARAKAKMKLVRVIIDQAPNDWRAAAFLLERSWPQEYARTERIEQVNEQADDKKLNLSIYYDTGGVGMEKLTTFPIHPSMKQEHDSPEVEREKQRRLLGQTTAEAPVPETAVAETPPPKVVPKYLTGRIPAKWKGNGK
jgi:transposase